MIKRIVAGVLRRSLSVELHSHLIRDRPIGIDQSTWDQEYSTGKWARLADLTEMPRYALIAGYCHTIGSASSVLDIGCGAGLLYRWISQDRGRRYFGVDLSNVAIEEARKLGSGEARFEVADATAFDPGERFDIIVLNEMLYYLDRPEQLLERCKGFLAPGGVLVISMWKSTESLETWRRCAGRVEVLDEVRARSANGIDWHVRLCRPV